MSRDKQTVITDTENKSNNFEDKSNRQIEEMEKIIQKRDDEAMYASIAHRLYDAGYRKASEVAEEIFEEIEASAKVKYWRGGGLVVFEVNGEDFAELKKKYTEGGE